MSYEYDEDLYAEDPFANPYGMDEQTMIDFLVANGAGAGMLPMVQPGSGKALTVANRTSALNANRSALFDTAFQGLGGAQAFAPGAFEPTISTTIRQEPELQQVYSYLRSPTSMEGIITQELMLGGTPATAQRALRQMLTATPEEMEQIFTRYDEFFRRAPSMTAADAESIKTNLLLELPPAFQDGIQMEVKPDGTGVDWNSSEDRSVFAQAAGISELSAQIPRIGPSGPKWGTDPTTGQPIQISAGGELQWSTDESGAPVMIEITETPSEAAKTFTDLGLPTPADEYTMEDFVSPETNAAFEMLPLVDEPVQAAMAAMMDPSLAPSNWQQQGPAAQLANGEPYVPGAGAPEQPDYSPLPEGAYGAWNDPNEPDRTEAAAWQELMNGAYGGWNVTNPLQNVTAEDRMRQAMTNAYGSWNNLNQGETAAPGDPRDYAYGDWNASGDEAPPPPDTVADARNAWLASQEYLTNPSAAAAPGYGAWNTLNQSGQAQPPIDPTAVYGGWNTSATTTPATTTPPTDNYMARALELFTGMPGPSTTTPSTTTAPSTTTPSSGTGQIQFQTTGTRGAVHVIDANGNPAPAGRYRPDLGDQMVDANGNVVSTPSGNMPGIAQLAARQHPTPRPPIPPTPPGPSGNPVAEALDLFVRGAQPTPPYAAPGAQPANQPGGPGFQNPQIVDAMLAQILPGNQQSTMNRPPAHLMPGAQPANQPGGPAFMEQIETGERRAAQRQEDEQNAQVLGGSTDRTGKRVRPTRTGEQARAFRAAMDQWHGALDQRNAVMQQSWGNPEFGQGVAQAIQMRRQGVRPIDQALMARRLVLMNAGMPQGI